MSYEPTILIKKSDLDKHSDKMDTYYNYNVNNESEESRVIKYIKEVYKDHDTPEIDGIKIILCRPELSSFNKAVRAKLDEWEVQYGLSN